MFLYKGYWYFFQVVIYNMKTSLADIKNLWIATLQDDSPIDYLISGGTVLVNEPLVFYQHEFVSATFSQQSIADGKGKYYKKEFLVTVPDIEKYASLVDGLENQSLVLIMEDFNGNTFITGHEKPFSLSRKEITDSEAQNVIEFRLLQNSYQPRQSIRYGNIPNFSGGTNVGDGEGIYIGDEDGILKFKTLIPGENVWFDVTDTTITINSSGGTGGDGGPFDGDRTVTREGIPNINVGGESLTEFIENYFFPAVKPSASLTGGGTRLYGNNAGVTLNYTATKGTYAITSIVIDGDVITVVDGNTQSGSKAETLDAPNTNKTFSMTVTDTEGNTGNASTSITFSHKRYFFGDPDNLLLESDATRSSSVNAKDAGGTAEFATSKAKSTFSITLSGEYFYYVIPTSFGTPAFTINGLANTDFTSDEFTFTNSNGYDASFTIYKSGNKLTGTFNISVQ